MIQLSAPQTHLDTSIWPFQGVYHNVYTHIHIHPYPISHIPYHPIDTRVLSTKWMDDADDDALVVWAFGCCWLELIATVTIIIIITIAPWLVDGGRQDYVCPVYLARVVQSLSCNCSASASIISQVVPYCFASFLTKKFLDFFDGMIFVIP